jgi:hypothetical protein
MLLTNSLFFAKLGVLQDEYEGKITHYDLEMEKNGIEYLKSIWGKNWSIITGDATPERHKFQKQLRLKTIVNCWHLNESESAMMWKLYSNYNYGIAIQSTVQKLDDSILYDEFPIDIRPVKYLDWKNEGIGKDQIFDVQLFIKRISFKHEKEIRAVIRPNFQYGNKQKKISIRGDGKLIPIDLNSLIETIHVSPYAKSWFVNLIKKVVEKYLPNKQVVQSNQLELR